MNDTQEVKGLMYQKLVEVGEKERLKEILTKRLVDAGWRDEVKLMCKRAVETMGTDNCTVDKLVAAVTPESRNKVPDSIKRELLAGIRRFLEESSQENYDAGYP